MEVREIGRTRLGRVIVVGLVGAGIATAYAFNCDCEIRLAPIVRGAALVSDPDGAIGDWRPDRDLYATDIVSVSVAPDDRTVTIKYEGGVDNCWLVGLVGVASSPKRIVLGIYGGFHRQPQGVVCTLAAYIYGSTLRFDEPVGGRPIEYPERLSSPFDG